MSTLKVTNLKGRSTYIDVNGSTRLDMTDANGLKLPTWNDDNRHPTKNGNGRVFNW